MKAKRVFAAILSAMMIMSFMAGCSGNTADVDNSSSGTSVSDTDNNDTEVIDAQEASGTVKELSQSKLVLALEDKTEVEFKLDDFEIPAELKIGDTVTVNYTESDNGVAVNNIESAPAKEEVESKPDDKPEEPSAPDQDNSQGNNKTDTGSAEVDYSGWTQQQKAEYIFRSENWKWMKDHEITMWTAPCFRASEDLYGFVFVQEIDEGNVYGPIGNPIDRNQFLGEVEMLGYGPITTMNSWTDIEPILVRIFNDYLGLPSESAEKPTPSPNPKPDTKPSDETKPPVEDNKGSSEAGDVYEAIELINKERVKAGLGELTIDDTLMEMAAVRAEELVWGYSQEPKKAHTRPDGSDWKTVFDDFGVKVTNKRGENAFRAKNLSDAKTAVDAWMNSSGHKANIMQKEIRKIGVGYYGEGPQNYWIMIVTE